MGSSSQSPCRVHTHRGSREAPPKERRQTCAASMETIPKSSTTPTQLPLPSQQAMSESSNSEVVSKTAANKATHNKMERRACVGSSPLQLPVPPLLPKPDNSNAKVRSKTGSKHTSTLVNDGTEGAKKEFHQRRPPLVVIAAVLVVCALTVLVVVGAVFVHRHT
jgi:hypothetical protein